MTFPARPAALGVAMRKRPGWSLVLLIATLGWILYKVDGLGVYSREAPCGMKQTSYGNFGERKAYELLVWYSKRHRPQTEVALVTLTPEPGPEPLDIFTNVCDSREFMSLLLPALESMHPAAVVIDKFYTKGACEEDDPRNSEFSKAVTALITSTPLIVGQAVHRAPSTEQGSDTCLALTREFRFGQKETPPLLDADPTPRKNLLFGLTRINENPEQIPLAWPVLQYDKDTFAVLRPGLALAAARQVSPGLDNVPVIKAASGEALDVRHPFGILRHDLPQWTAMDVLCRAQLTPGQQALFKKRKWDTRCGVGHQDFEKLKGKVIVIGEHVEGDLKPFSGGERYGVDLQGEYIDALLTNAFLREVPWWAEILILVILTCLLGIWESTDGHWLTQKERFFPHSSPATRSEIAYAIGGLTVFLSLCLVSTVLLLGLHIYTPLIILALWPLGITLVTRALTHIQKTGHRKVLQSDEAL